MPLVRAMRLINALEAGTLSGPDFASLITGDPTRAAELSVLYGMRGQARRLAASTGAFSKLLGSPKAVNLLVTNRVALQEVKDMPAALAVLLADDMALAKYLAVSAGLDPAAYSTVAALMSSISASPAYLGAMVSNAGEAGRFQVVKSAAAMTTVDAIASLRPLVYGEPLEGGYFGCINTVAGTRYAVIQAPKALGESAPIAWKTTNDASSGTDRNDDGLANANAQNNASHPLFQWARRLVINGKSDWAPPAYNVIQELAAKMRPALAENSRFKPGGAEAYEVATVPQYWSATQHPSYTKLAWYVDFSTGAVNGNAKSYASRARAVRRIIL